MQKRFVAFTTYDMNAAIHLTGLFAPEDEVFFNVIRGVVCGAREQGWRECLQGREIPRKIKIKP